MKTTKRSKMLVSSIAMLLVALVALGSATFAWYSINRTVGASDLTVKASTPGGLEIKDVTADGSWTPDTLTWTDSATLQPSTWTPQSASPGYTSLQVSDSTSTSSAQAGESLVNAPLAPANYVLCKTIALRNTNSVAGNVTCTLTSSNVAGSYMKMALVDADTGTIYAAIDSHTETATGAAVKYAKAPSSGEQAAQKTYYVIAYADGTDANCTTDNAKDSTKNTDINFVISFSMEDTTD